MISLDRGKLLLGLLFLLKFLPVWTLSMPSLSLSSRLNVGDTLVSPSGHFELGIVPFPGKYQLCIRYAAPIEPAVTWVANRDIPLSDHSYLELSSPDGNLQVFDPANDPNKPSWSSNSANAGVGKVQLLDTGNLVLVDNNGKQIWDSFTNMSNSSTDTLLPGQYFYKKDNRNLTSWLAPDDPASGPFTFGWGTRANISILQLAWKSPKTFMNWTGGAYIPAPDVHDPHTISNIEYVYFHATLGHLYIKSSPADTVILSGGDPISATTLKRITMDTDGGFRIWQWKVGQVSKKWTSVANWVVYERTESRSQCTAFGTCGQFGWCKSPVDNLDRVQCECPYGFKPLNDNDLTRGCTPVVPLNNLDCSDATKVRLLELDDIDMPWGGDYKNLTGPDSAFCKEECLKDCNCAGAAYSSMEQYCWMKTAPLFNLGYPTKALHGNDRVAYIKISIDQPSPVSTSESTRSKWIKWAKIIAPVVGGSTLILCISIFCWYRGCRFRGEAETEPDFTFHGPGYSVTDIVSPPRGTLQVETSVKRRGGET